MLGIDGSKVFSVSKARDRENLGEYITEWLKANPDKKIIRQTVTQSSDSEYHCISVVLFYQST